MGTFQENLRTFRERLGVNAKEFAAAIGLPYTKYIAYENKGVEPKYDTLIKIAAALHVSIDDLLGYQVGKLGYWLNKFPMGGLYAEKKNSDFVEMYINMGNGSGEITDRFTVAYIRQDMFVATMEKINEEVREEIAAQYNVALSFATSKYFLQGTIPRHQESAQKKALPND